MRVTDLRTQSPSFAITHGRIVRADNPKATETYRHGGPAASFEFSDRARHGRRLDSRLYRRLSTLDLNRASEPAAFATMGVWRWVVATVPLHPRFGADQKPKRSCSLRASKNRSRHRVTAFGVWRVWRLTFGVWAFVHMSPSSANSSTSSSAFSNIKKPSTLYSFLFLEPFDFQDRRYQKTGGPGRTHPRAAATDFCEMPRAGTMLFLNTGGL